MRGWLLALAFAIGMPAEAFAKDTVVVKLRDKSKRKQPAKKQRAKKQPARAAKRKPIRRKPIAKAKPKPNAKPAAERPRPMP